MKSLVDANRVEWITFNMKKEVEKAFEKVRGYPPIVDAKLGAERWLERP